MNLKVVIVGGIVFYAVQFLLGFVTGPILHERILADLYDQTASFWRPELNENPPNIGALMPYWIGTGLLFGFVTAWVYSLVGGSFAGAHWQRGLKFGLMLAVFNTALYVALHGFFNLPIALWLSWSGEGFLTYAVGGMALGAAAGKLSGGTAATA